MSASFKVRKINHKTKTSLVSKGCAWLKTHKKKSILIALILFGSVSAARLIIGSASNVGLIGPKSPILQDDYGHTNILLLGVAGSHEEGGNLSDSIMIVSVDPDQPSASFLSFPRDLFIQSEMGERKINEIYAAARYKHGDQEGLRIVKEALSDFTKIDLHYGAVVNFKVFEEAVDMLGGVNIFVPEEIHDPYYPDENYGYQTFIMRKGIQNIDGQTALKYARSRKTSSDYSRAQRQQDLLLSIRKKAAEQSLLTNIGQIKSFYEIFQTQVNTDMKITEILALAKLASKIDYRNSISAVLNDDPTQKGGFLYTPAKEFYDGHFVLLPASNVETQAFIFLTLITPEVFLENTQIAVLNGSDIPGLAGQMSTKLRRFGFHVIETGNYPSQTPFQQSFITPLSLNQMSGTLAFFRDFFGFPERSLEEIGGAALNPDELIDLQLILGSDAQD